MIVRVFGIAILMGLFQACSAQPADRDSATEGNAYTAIPSATKAMYAAEIEKQNRIKQEIAARIELER